MSHTDLLIAESCSNGKEFKDLASWVSIAVGSLPSILTLLSAYSRESFGFAT